MAVQNKTIKITFLNECLLNKQVKKGVTYIFINCCIGFLWTLNDSVCNFAGYN